MDLSINGQLWGTQNSGPWPSPAGPRRRSSAPTGLPNSRWRRLAFPVPAWPSRQNRVPSAQLFPVRKKGKKPKIPPMSDLDFDASLTFCGIDWKERSKKSERPVRRRRDPEGFGRSWRSWGLGGSTGAVMVLFNAFHSLHWRSRGEVPPHSDRGETANHSDSSDPCMAVLTQNLCPFFSG